MIAKRIFLAVAAASLSVSSVPVAAADAPVREASARIEPTDIPTSIASAAGRRKVDGRLVGLLASLAGVSALALAISSGHSSRPRPVSP
jgi:hypothetical protein